MANVKANIPRQGKRRKKFGPCFHQRWRTKKCDGQVCIVDGEQKNVMGRLASLMEIRQKNPASIHRRWRAKKAFGGIASLMATKDIGH